MRKRIPAIVFIFLVALFTLSAQDLAEPFDDYFFVDVTWEHSAEQLVELFGEPVHITEQEETKILWYTGPDDLGLPSAIGFVYHNKHEGLSLARYEFFSEYEDARHYLSEYDTVHTILSDYYGESKDLSDGNKGTSPDQSIVNIISGERSELFEWSLKNKKIHHVLTADEGQVQHRLIYWNPDYYGKEVNSSSKLLGLLLAVIGLFCALGAVLNWDWFMENRKARFVVKIFSKTGARIFYVLLGTGLLVLGVLSFFGIIQL